MDVTRWMPPGMDRAEQEVWAAAAPGDPHLAAALAWESWAAQAADAPGDGVVSVSTGSQTVSYGGPRSEQGRAAERARWHRARAKIYSAPMLPAETPARADDEALWRELT